MRRLWLVLLCVLALAACSSSDTASPTTTEATTTSTECAETPVERTTHRYAETEGVAANLQSIDVYPVDGCGPHPALVWVHGGGWRVGDKRNEPVEQKAAWAAEHGWVLVAVNYRLTQTDNDVRWPDQGEDVAAATAWVLDHAEEIGVDADQVALMGHSAGGHLVAILGADPELLGDHGHERDDVDCVVALDGAGYDLEARTELGGSTRAAFLVRSVFGEDPEVWAGASPTVVLAEAGGPAPDHLVVTRGTADRVAVAADLVDAVRGAGADAELVRATGYSHADVNDALGEADESVVTPAVEGFLDGCFHTV